MLYFIKTRVKQPKKTDQLAINQKPREKLSGYNSTTQLFYLALAQV